MAEDRDDERAKMLDQRIAAAKVAHAPKRPHQEDHYSQAHIAWRMVTELVAGLAIGFGIGYGLDVLLGTRPLFMVLFILLGFAAGVKTMMRTANEVQKKRQHDAAEKRKPGEGGQGGLRGPED